MISYIEVKKENSSTGGEKKRLEKKPRAYGNLSAHGMNSDTNWTCGPDPSWYRHCISKAKLEWFSCQEGHKSEMGLSPLDKSTHAS